MINKILNLMKFAENNLCELCSEIENIDHILSKCKKYDTQRILFPNLLNSDLISLLKTCDIKIYKDILKFLKINNIIVSS